MKKLANLVECSDKLISEFNVGEIVFVLGVGLVELHVRDDVFILWFGPVKRSNEVVSELDFGETIFV